MADDISTVGSGRRRPRRTSVAVVLAVLLTPGLWAVAGCGSDDASDGAAGTGGAGSDARSGYTVDPPPSVTSVALPNADGSGDVAMPAPAGGLRLVYFGYTSCPDVCPTTMSDVRRALATLSPEQRARVAFDMVTIDPARDTSERFTEYVHNFVPDGGALRTDDPALLQSASGAFGAQYKVETNEEGEVEVSHSAEVYAVDDQGTVVMQWPFGTSHEALAKDLKSLLGETNGA